MFCMCWFYVLPCNTIQHIPPVCPACCLVKFTVNIVRYLWQINKQSTICILHLFNLQFAKLNRSYFAKYSVQLSCYLWQTTR